ncbi:hypothetical protein JW930_00010 [Candidatus Woesearchaeota archaeon]|nr:hypothetical protein [Candidatus Woesearchaeota archaeon]
MYSDVIYQCVSDGTSARANELSCNCGCPAGVTAVRSNTRCTECGDWTDDIIIRHY